MTKVLLSIHVIAAIVAIGPVTVAASMFPAIARRAATPPASLARTRAAATTPSGPAAPAEATAATRGGPQAPAGASAGDRGGSPETLRLLHRICRVYAALGVVVPVFGLATATSLGVLTDAWLLVSIALTLVAAGVLGLRILPGQARVLAGAADRRLPMLTGVFNLLWATVVVLMIVRPGSTTGA